MCTLKLRNLAHGQLKSRFLAEIKENGQYQGFWQNQMKRAQVSLGNPSMIDQTIYEMHDSRGA